MTTYDDSGAIIALSPGTPSFSILYAEILFIKGGRIWGQG